uniref:Mannosyltransferase n=1 Tax=Araucaria cunninghamii TaxID=56994 RepID=A0A0D6R9T7_ARACU
MASSSLSELRRRRPEVSTTITPADGEDLRADSARPANSEGSDQIGWGIPFIVLIAVRTISARSNLIHDCDEVFNYWEPLHYLLYKSGFQTWEYSSEYALRSYLYTVLHALVAAPASWGLGVGQRKVLVFYLVRLVLGLASTISETALVVALSAKYGRRLAITTLFLLAFTSGCFIASTSLLPSTFSMYAITLASAALFLDSPATSVSVAAVGVLLGWPFSILTAAPLVTYALASGNFKRVFLAGAATSIFVMVLSILTDYYYYGRWTSSVLNLLVYNVVGGGESHLYGVEGPLFYLRNGFNNFNFALLLALLSLPVILITKKRGYIPLIIVVSPVYLWLMFMSLQPHKEERFLYPIYPLICLGAAAVLERFPDLVHKFETVHEESLSFVIAKIVRPLLLGFILAVCHSRTNALLYGYSAPMEVYKHMGGLNMTNGSVLCVGSEWHRFPSSFFVPSQVSEVRWIDDGFRGLLPFPFNETLGGTAAAPPYFNNQNKASDKQYITDIGKCSFLVELDLKREHSCNGSESSAQETVFEFPSLKPVHDLKREHSSCRPDSSTWETILELPFLDKEKSPALFRAFAIPWAWEKKNVFGTYKLLRRKHRLSEEI